MDFRGVIDPEVYLINFNNNDTEMPFSGKKGQFVLSLLGSYNLLDKSRLSNAAIQGYDNIKSDIIASSPKVIITFGEDAISHFLSTNRNVSELSKEVFNIKINDNSYKLILLENPEILLENVSTNPQSLDIFAKGFYTASQIISGDYVDILESKEILNAHSFEEFKNICGTRFSNDAQVSYDIETNARPPLFKGSKIIGFSVSNKTSGVYVSVDSLEWHMPEDEENKIWDYLINEIFEKKKLIIHNTMYERPYTLCCKNYEIGFDKADDTLVMARLLRNPKDSAGLKYQAQTNLKYPDWETGLNDYISGIRFFIERVGLGPDKFKPIYFKIDEGINIFNLTSTNEFKDLKEVDRNEIEVEINKLYKTICDLYSREDLNYIGQLISEKIKYAVDLGGIQDSTIPYNWIPDKLLSKYGAVDAIATYDLKDYFFEMMDRDSTDKVNLHKGYENWLEHMYVAYIMERNGLYWNDDIASKDQEFLTYQATECLRKLILSPCFEPYIKDSCEWKFKPLILSDYYPEIANFQGYEIIYDKDTGKYVIKFQGKRCKKDSISNIVIPSSYERLYFDKLKEFFYEEVNKASHYEELKEIYNPSSSTSSRIPFGILINETLMMGARILELHTLSTSPGFVDIKNELPMMDKKFLQIADFCCDADKLKEDYKKDWAKYRKQFYEGFVNLYQNCRNQVTTKEIKEILDRKNPVEVSTLDDGGIITVYDNLVVTGIDQDDETTWTPQFEWMINFRLFKKSAKLITSYIEGSVGRQSVCVVDKNEMETGARRLVRKRKYDTNISEDECYLMNAKWSPNTADTGRWRSAQHTIPWGSQVKKYYTSRFKGGTMLCPDYSQMEVRSLAAISHDENMLELFRSGKDFHSNTAASVYRKPVEEITTAERRFSKTATFSLLYGAMEQSFARNYCNGDLDYAKMVYDGFFRAYPKVQTWIKERHEEVQRDHRVSLELSNRFIKIEPDTTEGKGAIGSMLRKSQNFPIQAQSADLTGCVIWDIQKFFEDENLKSLIVMYVHDSIEMDISPFELIKVVTRLKSLLIEKPMERMGLPSKADVTLGCSLGHEIDMEDIEVNEDLTECTMHLKGYKDEIEDTVNNWKTVYSVVEIFDESFKDAFVSMSELFILRKAYSPTLGTMRQKGTCKVHIKY